jgi:hypothetical protein
VTGSTIVDVLIAVLAALLFWRLSMALIRALSTPPPEIDPEDVVVSDQDYRCTVCGAELTMRMVNVSEDKPPRHCREDMVPVWRP